MHAKSITRLVAMELDFRKLEGKWQRRWEEAGLFNSEPDPRGKKLYITVAYPYPSGGMHIGHVRTYTVPDIVARFKRMQGYNVLFPMAWHVTGTPIIGAVKRLKEREPKQMYVLKDVFRVPEGQLKNMAEPMGYARYFIESYVRDMKSLGYSIDWRRQFTTNDPHYRRFIEWQHGILHRKGLEKRGLHPVKWCLRDRNPVTTHDILEGESADIQEFTLIKFPLADGKGGKAKGSRTRGAGRDMLVAATLRPETIFGQTNMWVNPEEEYVRARVGSETWIISRECAEKLSHQKRRVKVLGPVPGRSLIGRHVRAPGVRNTVPVLPSEFCDPRIGTGIVTSVPSDAPWDWVALRDLQENRELAERHGLDWAMIKSIKVIPIIRTREWGDQAAVRICERMRISSQREREKLEEATRTVYREGFHRGVMNRNCGRYSGMKVERAKELVRRDLIRKGRASTMLEFSEPVVCRCGGTVIVARTESWFIDYANRRWKSLVRSAVRNLRNIPSGAKQDFEHTVEWLGEWPCVRNFGLGTPLPQDKRFIIEPLSDSTIYMAFYLVAHVIKRYRPEQLTPAFFDYVMLGRGRAASASKSTGIPVKELTGLRKSVRYWYPLDWRCSALELIPNHLTFMLFHHAAIFPRKDWPRGIATWGMGLLEGGKMSSSKGNVVLAGDAAREYGADTVRFFLFSSTEPWQDFDWRSREVRVAGERLRRWYERVLRLSRTGSERKPSLIDRWLLSETNRITGETTKALESFETRKASLECFFGFSDAVRWYERRAAEPNSAVLKQVLDVWIRLMSPFVPHMCDELWEGLGRKGFASASQWPKADPKAINPRLGRMEDLVRQTSEDIASILRIVKKRPREVRIYVAPNWKHVLHNKILGMASSPDSIIPAIMKSPEGRKQGRDALRFAQRLAGSAAQLREVLTEAEELEALNDAKTFLEKQFKCKIQIIQSYKGKGQKALRSEPGKPGIEVISSS
jgi:leucyl-tRNA synthetase